MVFDWWMVLAGIPVGAVLLIVLGLRRVAATNEVHIVQSARRTVSYGKDSGNGNTYYAWPSWVPVIGISRVILPVSVFDLDLAAYEAYDKGRLPFVVDVKAFFRITDSNVAAQRVSSFTELLNQLRAVVQGAIRVILASNDIEEILQGRSKFGDEFTREVDHQLTNWGVSTVKNIELMDLRDGKDSHVIHAIMAKKKSHIDMESRTEVAKNAKLAEVAEIEARREVALRDQEAKQAVGLRTIEAEREVALLAEGRAQAVKEQQRLTTEREMAVREMEGTRTAEIARQVRLVEASRDKDAAILLAEGQLEAKRREAAGIQAEGEARAAAETALQLAPVQAQTELARAVGENTAYQQYLVTIRQVDAARAIGVAQAEALARAEVKVIATAGTAGAGVGRVSELFSAQTGVALGSALEGFAQTGVGRAVLARVTGANGSEPHSEGME